MECPASFSSGSKSLMKLLSFDMPHFLYDAGFLQKTFGQSGFSTPFVSDKSHVTNTGNFYTGHESLPAKSRNRHHNMEIIPPGRLHIFYMGSRQLSKRLENEVASGSRKPAILLSNPVYAASTSSAFSACFLLCSSCSSSRLRPFRYVSDKVLNISTRRT